MNRKQSKEKPRKEPLLSERFAGDDREAERDLSPWPHWVRRGIVAVGVITCIYTAAFVWSSGANADTLFSYTYNLLLVVPLILLNILIRCSRFYFFTRYFGWSVPFGVTLSAFISSLCFSITPGKVGELIKFGLLRAQYPISISEGLAIHVMERIIDLLIILTFALTGILIFAPLQSYIAIAGSAITLSTVLILNPIAHKRVIDFVTRITWFQKFYPHLSTMSYGLQALLKPIPFLAGCVLGTLAWACEIAALYILLATLNIQTSLLEATAIYGISVLAGALSMMPGGIGGLEIMMGFLLLRVGANSGDAAIAVSLFRISTLWLSSVIGLTFLMKWAYWRPYQRADLC